MGGRSVRGGLNRWKLVAVKRWADHVPGAIRPLELPPNLEQRAARHTLGHACDGLDRLPASKQLRRDLERGAQPG